MDGQTDQQKRPKEIYAAITINASNLSIHIHISLVRMYICAYIATIYCILLYKATLIVYLASSHVHFLSNMLSFWMFGGIENTWKTFVICVIFVFEFPSHISPCPNLHSTVPVLRSHLCTAGPHLHRRRITSAQCSLRQASNCIRLYRELNVCAIYKNYDTDTPNLFGAIMYNAFSCGLFPNTHKHTHTNTHTYLYIGVDNIVYNSVYKAYYGIFCLKILL